MLQLFNYIFQVFRVYARHYNFDPIESKSKSQQIMESYKLNNIDDQFTWWDQDLNYSINANQSSKMSGPSSQTRPSSQTQPEVSNEKHSVSTDNSNMEWEEVYEDTEEYYPEVGTKELKALLNLLGEMPTGDDFDESDIDYETESQEVRIDNASFNLDALKKSLEMEEQDIHDFKTANELEVKPGPSSAMVPLRSDDEMDTKNIKEKPHGFIRPYQVAIAATAIQKNTIACLPTGSGKTVVGLKVMNHFKSAITPTRKIFFFANTIPLIKQQAEVIKKCTTFKVEMIHGKSSGSQSWLKNWNETFSLSEVFVIIPTIFLHLIDHGFLQFRNVALIVIDECHNATRADATSMIMRRYRETFEQYPDYPLPRILGLTATILKRNLSSIDRVPSAIKAVENLLCCTAVTCDEAHKEEVVANSTSATIIHSFYKVEEMNEKNRQILDPLLKSGILINTKMETVVKDANKIKPSSIIEKMLHANKLNQDNEFYKDLLKVLSDLQITYLSIGPIGAIISANMKLEFFKIEEVAFFNKNNIMKYFSALLLKFMFTMQKIILNCSNYEEFYQMCKPKTQTLLDILAKYRENTEDFCGIVFVERRSQAHCLGALFDEISVKYPTEWGFLRAGVVVGTNRNQNEPSNYRQTSTKQQEVLDAFRSGSFNVVVATSILSEGIDVQACSFVIRFDLVMQYPSFVQSMGRARKNNAKYYVMLPDCIMGKEKDLIDKFGVVRNEIDRALILQGKFPELTDTIELDEEDIKIEKKISKLNNMRFCPENNTESPLVTMHAAISLVNRFCSLLKSQATLEDLKKPKDYISNPLIFIQSLGTKKGVEDHENDLYKGFLKLPSNSPIGDVIEGPRIVGKINSKRAVYLKACKLLHEAGLLDPNLLPERKRLTKKT